MLNAQKVEGSDGLRRTKSNEEEDEEDSSRFEETTKAASKGDAQWKSLKSRGATGAATPLELGCGAAPGAPPGYSEAPSGPCSCKSRGFPVQLQKSRCWNQILGNF